MSDKAAPGRQIPDRDEAIAALFYACYPKLVRTGYSVAGDWAVAEEMARLAWAPPSGERERTAMMKTPIARLDEFAALDPFFRVIEEGLDGLAGPATSSTCWPTTWSSST